LRTDASVRHNASAAVGTRQPYFVLKGNVCALLAAKAWVNVFLYDGAIVPDPEAIVTGGHDNKTARTVGRDIAQRRSKLWPVVEAFDMKSWPTHTRTSVETSLLFHGSTRRPCARFGADTRS